MGVEESRVEKALKLVDAGASKAAAAKACGISRQAIDDGLKRRATREALAGQARTCSECGAPLPADARADTSTCSARCRTAKSRRLAKERDADLRQRVAAERQRLGLPAVVVE